MNIQNQTSFYSSLLVTPKGGHQRRSVFLVRMASRSILAQVETMNLETHAMKDEEKLGLFEEDDGQSSLQLTSK